MPLKSMDKQVEVLPQRPALVEKTERVPIVAAV
jgi:hypothetical protein